MAGKRARTPGAESFCGDGSDKQFGPIHFAHDSFLVSEEGDQNSEAIRHVVEHLNQLEEPALVFTVGYATSVGVDGYNRHLTDTRAACASQCIRERLDAPDRFEFREMAQGEAFVAHDPSGARPESRRVDVIVCPMFDGAGRQSLGLYSDVKPSASDCGCP